MQIAFRTDASLQIGTGHVMRCLTLADALKAHGAQCHFISRAHPGHLFDLIRQRGFAVTALPAEPTLALHPTNAPSIAFPQTQLTHAAWLGCDWQTDAEQTDVILDALQPDWLITDHYALAKPWEAALKPHYKRLLVIDDLADREHICDVLLDQNLVEGMEKRYQGNVPKHCTCLIGPQYALVRPEFSALRPASLARRSEPQLNRLLIFMGGSDPDNETQKVIAGVKLSKKTWQHIDVVVGQSFPALETLKASLATLPTATLHVQTPDMAKLMGAADLAVTAGGSVTWERCTLGLPSVVAILGENQRPIATMMHERGAQRTMGLGTDLTPVSYAKSLDEVQANELTAMSDCSSTICDGTGISKVLKVLLGHT